MTKTLFFTSMGILTNLQADWALYDREQWIDVTAHMRVVGATGSGDFEELASHGHDPNRELTLQGIEVGTNLRLNDHVQGFATANIFRSLEDELEVEWEEGFLKLADLPGGFEVRGGRFLNRFGVQNSVHLHGWDFVDANLVTAGFLGEDGLGTEGGELTWIWQGPVTSAFSLAFGNAVSHDHAGHDEHDEHDEHGDEEEHAHGGAEDAYFADSLVTGRWLIRWDRNDYHRHEWGANFGLGENGYGRDSRLYSGDYYYTYRSNGLDPGGRFLRMGGELFYREVEWRDEEMGIVEEGSGENWGAVVSATYGFAENWEAGLRYDWIQGEASGPDPTETVFEIEERQRWSAALTRRFELAENLRALARLQVNFDDLPEGQEQSAFLQVGFDWGGPEVR